MVDYQMISAEEARALIGAEAVTILDVRDRRSYRNGHITGARLLHEGTEQALLNEGAFDRPLLIYCYHGNSSRAKAERFTQLGFHRVYNLEGGYTGWPREAGPTPPS